MRAHGPDVIGASSYPTHGQTKRWLTLSMTWLARFRGIWGRLLPRRLAGPCKRFGRAVEHLGQPGRAEDRQKDAGRSGRDLESVDEAGGDPGADAGRARDEFADRLTQTRPFGDDVLARTVLVRLSLGERIAEWLGDAVVRGEATGAKGRQPQHREVQRG